MKFNEEKGNLFELDEKYHLAHCNKDMESENGEKGEITEYYWQCECGRSYDEAGKDITDYSCTDVIATNQPKIEVSSAEWEEGSVCSAYEEATGKCTAKDNKYCDGCYSEFNPY